MSLFAKPNLFSSIRMKSSSLVLRNFQDIVSRQKCTGTAGNDFRHNLKGHGNEADFLGFLQKSVRHRFLTLNFEPFRFGLRIRGDIHNRKTTPRLAESGSRQECL
jgi:hypothetical protein